MASRIPPPPMPSDNTAPAATPDVSAASADTPAPTQSTSRVPPPPMPTEAAPQSTAPADTGNSLIYDVFHPQAADLSRPQTWRDWATKTYSPSATDFGNAALDDVSMGTADYAQSKLTGEDVNAIRARTAASQTALGPMAPVVAAGTYVVGPGKLLGPLAAGVKGVKAGATAARAAIEGFGAGAISSEGHELGSDKSQTERAVDALKSGTESAAAGVGGNLIARGVATAAKPAFNYAQGAPGRAGDQVFGNWRQASAAGQDISPAVEQFQNASGFDMGDVLKAQQTGTGAAGDVLRGAGRTAGHAAAAHFAPILGWVNKTPGDVGEWAANQAINKVRNYRTQNALDQAYPTVTGQPLNADTSGWTRAIQQGLIGSLLP